MNLSSTSSDDEFDEFTTELPKLRRLNAYKPPKLLQSQTSTVMDEDALRIKKLACAIYSVSKKLGKNSFSHGILVKLIKIHLKLKSNGKALYYLGELQRRRYIYIPSFANDKSPVYAFCMQAILSFRHR